MKKKEQLLIIFKLAVVALCLFLLIHNIKSANLRLAFTTMSNASTLGIAILTAGIITLLSVNLFLETIKWHLLVHQYGGSLFSSFKQVLGGIAGGFISPNHIGDPFTRSYMLPERFRARGLLPATLCSFSQLLATAIFGSLAIIHSTGNSMPGIIKLAITQVIIVGLVVLLIWFAMRFFENQIGKIRLVKAVLVVGLSLVRYFVFSTELWLIFLLFAPNVKFEPMFFGIALTFLANTALPSFAFTELGIRAAGASLFFPMFGIDGSIAAIATMLLWFVNMAIPAIPGMLLLLSNGISLGEIKQFKNEIMGKVPPQNEVEVTDAGGQKSYQQPHL